MQSPPDEIPDCSRTFCGCWEETVLDFKTTIFSEQNKPLEGIEIYCTNEKTPITVSDDSGLAQFKVSTEYSPGCHYERCTYLIFKDKNRKYKDHRLTVYQANGKAVYLTQ